MVKDFYSPGDDIVLLKKEKKPSGRILRFFYRLVLVFFLSTFAQVFFYKFFPPLYTPLMVQRSIESIFSGGNKLSWDNEWVPYDKINSVAGLAVVASEDQNFPNHFGFDLKAIQTAMNKNKKGKRIKGASTISQQVAKNLFLLPNRNYVRKALELYYTLLIETFWSKERILEMYLNIGEMGNMVFGVESASHYYFNKKASQLKKPEAALIAAVLPNPRKYSIKKPTNYILRRKAWIMNQMGSLGDKYLKDL